MLTIVHTRFKIAVRGKVVTVVILVVLLVQAKIIVRFLMTMVDDLLIPAWAAFVSTCVRHGGGKISHHRTVGKRRWWHDLDRLTDAYNTMRWSSRKMKQDRNWEFKVPPWRCKPQHYSEPVETELRQNKMIWKSIWSCQCVRKTNELPCRCFWLPFSSILSFVSTEISRDAGMFTNKILYFMWMSFRLRKGKLFLGMMLLFDTNYKS